MTVDNDNLRRGMLLRSLVSFVGFVLIVGAMLFIPAGIGWRNGWLFELVFVVCTLVSVAYLWRANPDIFVARSRVHQGTKPWDFFLMIPILLAFFAFFVIAGLDARYGWSLAPRWVKALGYVLFVLGYGLSSWVYAVNKFAEPSVRIQSDRGHKVIDDGPYAIVRHPLYSFSGFVAVGMALALGSYWALVPVAAGAVLIIVRTMLEDRTLHRELEGYPAYAARVRFRLIPGIW
jgi:protein-S-isoprenylcysteine O-methyltransferase Ste14